MDILGAVKGFRKTAADIVLNNVRMHPDEATRVSMWLCFATSSAILLGAWLWALLLLIAGLFFDVVDGAMARRYGVNRPEVDWAADRYTEFIIFAALIFRGPGPFSLAFFLLFLFNNFLPVGKIPILPLRQVLVLYIFIRLLVMG